MEKKERAWGSSGPRFEPGHPDQEEWRSHADGAVVAYTTLAVMVALDLY